MSDDQPCVGQHIKVFLPGESPWAEVVAVLTGGEIVGRIDNELVASSPALRAACARDWFGSQEPLPSLHDWKRDDLVVFERRLDEHGFRLWRPAERVGGKA